MLFAIYGFLTACLFADKRGTPWFLYHHIGEKGVPENWFEEHLKFISYLKMKSLTNRDVLKYMERGKRVPRNSVLITFDDGYYDNYKLAYPLLKKYGMKATLYLNTAYVEEDIPERKFEYLSWKEIKEMSDSGHMDIQLHSHRHMPIFVNTKLERVIEEKDLKDREIQYIYGDDAKIGYPIFRKRGEYSSKGVLISLESAEKFRKMFLTLEGTEKEKIEKAQRFIDENLFKEFIYENNEMAFQRVEEDLNKNMSLIEENCGYRPTFFCWPWGHKSKEFTEFLEKKGIKGFVTTKKGTNIQKHNLKNIKRVELRSFTPNKFKLNLLVCRNLILGKIYQIFS
jgi:peptidoglycan/xylan/chitin deacetylase (PgdA/CDA1 family)